jgi:DNA-binding MarR family transcriptional regulator
VKIEKFLNASPIFSVIDTGRSLENLITKFFESEDVHYLQAMTLAALFFEDDGAKPQDLAMTLKTTKGNMSHCISDLESKKLIRRNLVKGDGRSFQIILTDLGKEKTLKIIRFFDSTQNIFEKTLSEDSVQNLITNLKQIESILITS